LRGAMHWVEALAILEPEKVVFAANRDGFVRRWDLQASPWTGGTQSNIITDIASGNWLGHEAVIAACHDRWIKIWDRHTGGVLAEHEEVFNDSSIARISFCNQDLQQRIAIAGPPGAIRIWDGTSITLIGEELGGTKNYVTAARCYRVKGNTFVVTSELDGTLRLFHLESGRELKHAKTESTALAIAYLGSDPILLSGTPHNAVAARDPLSLEILQSYPLDPLGKNNRVMAVAGSKSGEPMLAAGTQNRKIWIRSLRTADLLAGPFEVERGFPTALALGTVKGAAVIAIGSVEGEVTVRYIETGTVVCRIEFANITALSMPADSELVVGCIAGAVLLTIG
jgi:WD40 repeat protein